MALIATVGGEDSNSYQSVADFNARIAERVNNAAALEATNEEKERALISATRRLDQESYAGCKASTTQALEFPRADIYDKDGWPYKIDQLPLPLLLAHTELAFVLLTSPELLDDTGLEGFDTLSVGDLSMTPRRREAGALPANVRRYLRGLITSGSGYTRLVRG